jgi:hypothetical protein
MMSKLPGIPNVKTDPNEVARSQLLKKLTEINGYLSKEYQEYCKHPTQGLKLRYLEFLEVGFMSARQMLQKETFLKEKYNELILAINGAGNDSIPDALAWVKAVQATHEPEDTPVVVLKKTGGES